MIYELYEWTPLKDGNYIVFLVNRETGARDVRQIAVANMTEYETILDALALDQSVWVITGLTQVTRD